MSTTTEPQSTAPRLHTIGAVCERLRAEFNDITISKIRYLEDQGLLQPRRTRGGYRLFSEGDIERLQTILRLQRDEFLPLRVIRTELDAHGTTTTKRRAPALHDPGGEIDVGELCERAGIAAACGRLARHGLDARHLRAFRTAAGRQSALLEQLVAPGLRSRDHDRRRAALDDLEALAAVATELAQHLLVRDLREASER